MPVSYFDSSAELEAIGLEEERLCSTLERLGEHLKVTGQSAPFSAIVWN